MPRTTQELADRVFASALGAIEIYSIHIGDRLGLYRALASAPKTSGQLAAETGVDQRYAREWLEQQATSGLLDVDLTGPEPMFHLPDTHRDVVSEERSAFYLAPLARMLTTAGTSMPLLLEAYRSGGGVSWDTFGHDMRESQADMNRPFFDNDLPTSSAVSDLYTMRSPAQEPALPTSAVALVGPLSPWPAPTPGLRFMASTSTPLRSTWPHKTRPPPAWQIELRSMQKTSCTTTM